MSDFIGTIVSAVNDYYASNWCYKGARFMGIVDTYERDGQIFPGEYCDGEIVPALPDDSAGVVVFHTLNNLRTEESETGMGDRREKSFEAELTLYAIGARASISGDCPKSNHAFAVHLQSYFPNGTKYASSGIKNLHITDSGMNTNIATTLRELYRGFEVGRMGPVNVLAASIPYLVRGVICTNLCDADAQVVCDPVTVTLLADSSTVSVPAGGAYSCDNRPVTVTDTDTAEYTLNPGDSFVCSPSPCPPPSSTLTANFGATDCNQVILFCTTPLELVALDSSVNLDSVTYTLNGAAATLPLSLTYGDKFAIYPVRSTPGLASQVVISTADTDTPITLAAKVYQEVEPNTFFDDSENGRYYGFCPGGIETDYFCTKITYDPAVTFSGAYYYAMYGKHEVTGNTVGYILTEISGASHAIGLTNAGEVDPVNSYATWSSAMNYQVEVLNQRAIRVYEGGVLVASINLTNAINNGILIGYDGANIYFAYMPATDESKTYVVLYTSPTAPSGNYKISLLPQDRTPNGIYGSVRCYGNWRQ